MNRVSVYQDFPLVASDSTQGSRLLTLPDRMRSDILHRVGKELATWTYEELYNYTYDRFVEELAIEAGISLRPTTGGVEL